MADNRKLLIAIPTCHRYSYFDASTSPAALHHDGDEDGRASAIRDSWYKLWRQSYSGLIDLKFFIGLSPELDRQSPPQLAPDTVELEVPDDYIHLSLKVKEMFRWALEQGYDYVLKVDDDVYVWLDRLLSRFTPTDYLGHVAERDTGRYICGASYWISRKAMQLVVDADWTLDEWAEDRWVGKVLQEGGITLTHDDRHRVCHCDICDLKYPASDCTTMHVWPDIRRMFELHEASK